MNLSWEDHVQKNKNVDWLLVSTFVSLNTLIKQLFQTEICINCAIFVILVMSQSDNNDY